MSSNKLSWLLLLLSWVPSALAASPQLNPQVVWAMPESARIKCVTDAPGKMTVEYGLTPSLGMTSTDEMRDWPERWVTRHYVNLIGLTPDTTYYYRVRIQLEAGGELVSDIRTFKTYKPIRKVLPTVRYCTYIAGSGNLDFTVPRMDMWLAALASKASEIESRAPGSITIFYDNLISNLSLSPNRDIYQLWMSYCDENNISYERIALHYAVDTKVDWGSNRLPSTSFIVWLVEPGGTFGGGRENPGGGQIILPKRNIWIVVSHMYRFDRVYINIVSPASGGYDGVWEYCSAIDSEGRPIEWTPLQIVEDTTMVDGQKLARSGYVQFVPPKERTHWKRSRAFNNDSDGWLGDPPMDFYYRVFSVRFRVTNTSGTGATIAAYGIHHEDFTPRDPENSTYYTIPGWDVSWETNPDNNGDPEYNPNPPASGGLGVARSARFKWWSRAWWWQPQKGLSYFNARDEEHIRWRTTYFLDKLFTLYPDLDGWYNDNFSRTRAISPAVEPTVHNTIEMGIYSQEEHGYWHAELMETMSIALTARGKISSANNFFPIPWRFDRFNQQSGPDWWMWATFSMAICNRENSSNLNSAWHMSSPYAANADSGFGGYLAELLYRTRNRGHYTVPIYAIMRARDSDKWQSEDWWFREKMMALALYLLAKDPEDEYIFLNAWNSGWVYSESPTSSSADYRYYILGIPQNQAYFIDAAMRDFGRPITTVEPPFEQWIWNPYGSHRFPGYSPGVFVLHYTNQAPRLDSEGNVLANDANATYFARRYTKALVVYRTGNCRSNAILGPESMNEYTEANLGGRYYRLRADNTLEPGPITKINLRQQEAAILIPEEYIDEPPPPSNPDIQITISTDKTNPKPLDVITVTITARNNGAGEARNVRIRHTVPNEATYIQGSLKLNGQAQADPVDGRSIDLTVTSIPAGGQAVVQFQMVIR